jgi:hypothetical protein
VTTGVTTYQIVYWRDIPAQVKVRAGRVRAAKPLSDRFQVAIDQAAMRTGTIGTDAYLAEWWASAPCERDGDPGALATQIVAELEAAYPPDRLRALADNGGRVTE